MTYDINTVEDVVAALGGAEPAAEWAGCGESGIYNWIARNCIPPSRHLRLMVRFKREGRTFNPALFELSDDEVHVLFGAEGRRRPSGNGAAAGVSA